MTNKPTFHAGTPTPRLVYAWEGEVAALRTENERLLNALRAIQKLVYTPTPGKMPAHVHFQRDFDAIRKLCADAITPAPGESAPQKVD